MKDNNNTFGSFQNYVIAALHYLFSYQKIRQFPVEAVEEGSFEILPPEPVNFARVERFKDLTTTKAHSSNR